MKSKLPRPTESELDILKVLWAHGPLTVREVHECLATQTGYTTVLKLMQIMAEKALVVRDESQRAHVYTAAIDEGETKQQAVQSLAGKLFGGSGLKLAMQALGQGKASPEELAEMRRLIDAMEQKPQKRKR
ncbi:BlaI/MecI/CopY family transcriptional regulator [Cerasicoccus frondis]|uniref:BlaI/MecI/CopY family transcriptional regulator n=1 Tax=Cerasicoccus frondis TaxID=490090 RepID=UPI00285294D6|nr:BlaI/MecI/CopY family transcriptional regulator [Cerasicoccus frondis]